MDLSTSFLGVPYAHPIVLADGPWLSTYQHALEAIAGGAAGVSVNLHGYAKPAEVVRTAHASLYQAQEPSVIGASPKVAAFLERSKVPVSIAIRALPEEAESAAALSPTFIEVHLGTAEQVIPATVKKAIQQIVQRVGTIPVLVRIPLLDEHVAGVAEAAAEAGARGLIVLHGAGPGLRVDLHARRALLGGAGMMYGPGLKPVAVRCIADCYRATQGALPIIGMGGVETGEDALELLIAGATLIAVDTAFTTHGPRIFTRIAGEMVAWGQDAGVASVPGLTGTVQTAVKPQDPPVH